MWAGFLSPPGLPGRRAGRPALSYPRETCDRPRPATDSPTPALPEYSFSHKRPFSSVADMQLFVRAQELHTLEVTGQETVSQIKVRLRGAPRRRIRVLFHLAPCGNAHEPHFCL